MVASVYLGHGGSWVVYWPGGYSYDFWTDRAAALGAAHRIDEILSSRDVDRERVDEQLHAEGLLRRARTKRRLPTMPVRAAAPASVAAAH